MAKVFPAPTPRAEPAWQTSGADSHELAAADSSHQSIPHAATDPVSSLQESTEGLEAKRRIGRSFSVQMPPTAQKRFSGRSFTAPTPLATQTSFDRRHSGLDMSNRTSSLFCESPNLRSMSKNVPVFADAEALKEQIPENLANNQDDEDAFYSETGVFQWIARCSGFVNLSLFMVVISSVWIGVEVDNDEGGVVFQIAAHFFCFYFLCELVVRLLALRRKRDVFDQRFLRLQFGFDAILVLFVLIDTWVVPALVGIANAQPDANARFLLVLRLLRILRVLRVIRVVRQVPELLLIIKGVVMALRPIIVVMSLIGLIIYVFAIVFRVALHGTEIGTKWFSSTPASMTTLLTEAVLSGTKGGPLMREAYNESPLAAVFLFVFVITANITMMGVLGGLLVHTVRTVAEVEKEEHSVKEALAHFDSLWRNFLKRHDVDGDGRISAPELKKLFCDKKSKRLFEKVQIDLNDLEDVSDFVFDESGGSLTKTQLQKTILEFRSKNTAKVKDHVVTRKFFQSELHKIFQRCTQGPSCRCSCAYV
jgi:hypothetical protein